MLGALLGATGAVVGHDVLGALARCFCGGRPGPVEPSIVWLSKMKGIAVGLETREDGACVVAPGSGIGVPLTGLGWSESNLSRLP